MQPFHFLHYESNCLIYSADLTVPTVRYTQTPQRPVVFEKRTSFQSLGLAPFKPSQFLLKTGSPTSPWVTDQRVDEMVNHLFYEKNNARKTQPLPHLLTTPQCTVSRCPPPGPLEEPYNTGHNRLTAETSFRGCPSGCSLHPTLAPTLA